MELERIAVSRKRKSGGFLHNESKNLLMFFGSSEREGGFGHGGKSRGWVNKIPTLGNGR